MSSLKRRPQAVAIELDHERYEEIINGKQPFAEQEDVASPDCSVRVNADLWFPDETC